jgi:hypothetical protein
MGEMEISSAASSLAACLSVLLVKTVAATLTVIDVDRQVQITIKYNIFLTTCFPLLDQLSIYRKCPSWGTPHKLVIELVRSR